MALSCLYTGRQVGEGARLLDALRSQEVRMADDGPGLNKTQIWVTVITVIGGLLTAVIVNADKWIHHDPAPAAAPSAATPAGSGAAAPAPAAGASDSKVTAAPSAPAPEAATAPAPVIVDIGGEWRDDDGARFTFTQKGTHYDYVHTASNGTMQSAGKGSISGRDLAHTFEMATGETGTCTARLNAAGNKISGNCLFQDGGWTFVLER
jgi:hypothetical protein